MFVRVIWIDSYGSIHATCVMVSNVVSIVPYIYRVYRVYRVFHVVTASVYIGIGIVVGGDGNWGR